MELLFDCSLRNVLITRKDLFGEQCVFIKFEMDSAESYDWTCGLQSSARFGRIVFQRDDKVQYSDHLVLKATPPRLYTKDFSMLQFSNEVLFYTRILPFFETHREVKHLFPQYYNSLLQYHVNADDAVIVFENIQTSGYVPSPKKSFLDYDHLALMLRKLGEFHAYSYHAKQVDPDHFYSLISTMLETNLVMLKKSLGFIASTIERGFRPLSHDSHYNLHCSKLRKLFGEHEEIIRHTLTGDKQNDTHVLCHGDFLRNNVLFKYANGKPIDLKLVDMATWRFASPVLDLSLVLYLNADQKMRYENWDKLIDEYYTAMRNTFPSGKVPSKNSILTEFKNRALNAYFIASYFLSTLIEDDSVEHDTAFRKYKETAYKDDVTFDSLKDYVVEMGGKGTTIQLSNILKDMVDRGFV